jgi:hypothetical protein
MDKYQQRSFFLGLLLCLPVLAVQAAAPALFEAEVVVSDQTPAQRSVALKSALGEVLVRVTGQGSVLDTPAVQTLLAGPEQLVQQYRYFTEPNQEPPLLKLWVRFDGDAIRQTLQQQGLAYWGGERPDTLVWLAVEDRGNRYLVSADDASEVHRQVAAAARARGVPVLFPLMDLEDQARVRYADVWGGFFDKVVSASQRYNPPVILIGRLNRMPSGGWASRWQLEMGGKTRSWSDSHPQLDVLAKQGIDDLADVQASQLAITTNAAGSTVVISVTGINTLAAYARTNNYLASLSSIRNLQVGEVKPGAVQYTLQLNGSMQDLTRTVAIGTVLAPAADGMPGNYLLRQ